MKVKPNSENVDSVIIINSENVCSYFMRLGHQAVFSVCGDAVSVQPVRHGLRVVRSCEAFDLVVTVRELPGFITGVSKAPKKPLKIAFLSVRTCSRGQKLAVSLALS